MHNTPRPRRRTLALLLLSLLGVTAMAATFIYVTQAERQEKRYQSHAGELRLLSLRLMADALLASEGEDEAFARVEGGRRQGSVLLGLLKNGDPGESLPPLPEPAHAALLEAERAWQNFQSPLQAIHDTRPEILTVREYIRALNDIQPELSALVEATAHVLVDADAQPKAVYHATRQALLTQRITTTANRLLNEGTLTDRAIAQMHQDLADFRRSLTALREGSGDPDLPPRIDDPRARTQLDVLAALFDTTAELVQRIAEQGPALERLRQTRQRLSESGMRLNQALEGLNDAIHALSRNRPVDHLTAYVLGGIVALSFLGLGLLMVRDARQRFAREAAQHQRQRRAITALCDEIHPLGEGDLTIRATAHDPLLEPVAHAINYAVEALRRLVTTIERTAQGVAVTAEETQATALHLRRASQHQSEQIHQAAQTITELAQESDRVHREAQAAVTASGEALHSAEQGAAYVRECRAGLRALDDQLGRTAKQVKRLGEGAQEIGDIVELISDIADQTNVLALNAAIHASTKSEPDGEFARIADDVQRLAERTNQAARRIETLIQTIQEDTQATVTAIEQNREQLSATLRRAERARLALVDIQQHVARLAEWVETVARITQEQAAGARRTASAMEWIRGVAVRNLAGSEQTAELAQELAQQAQALREAVQGFQGSDTAEANTPPTAAPQA